MTQYNIRVAEVLRTMSRATDIAAVRPYGFGQSVASVALALADIINRPDLRRGDLLLAGLLHGAGMASVAGDVARMILGNERPSVARFPADWLLLAVDETSSAADGASMTGRFLRHHMHLCRFPEASAIWLERIGFSGPAVIVRGLLERWDGRGYLGLAGQAIPLETRLLSVAYQFASLREIASLSSDHPVVEDARDLVATDDWLAPLCGTVFAPDLCEAATTLWNDAAFWQASTVARSPVLTEEDAATNGDDGPITSDHDKLGDTNDQASEVSELMANYVVGLHDVDGDIPGIDRHIDELLFPELQGFLEPTSPVLKQWLQLLCSMADAKAAFEVGHGARVAGLAGELGLVQDLEDQALQALEIASLVYGVGRLALPSALLESAMPLSQSQRALIREYPRVTRSVLAPMVALGSVVESAYLHAERMDGSGYPEARVGHATPLSARILAVADTYEALIASRPYRLAHARSRALAIIQAQSGAMFDGLVTDSLEAVARGQV